MNATQETRNLRNRAVAAREAGLVDDSFVADVFDATDGCGWFDRAIDTQLRAVGA